MCYRSVKFRLHCKNSFTMSWILNDALNIGHFFVFQACKMSDVAPHWTIFSFRDRKMYDVTLTLDSFLAWRTENVRCGLTSDIYD